MSLGTRLHMNLGTRLHMSLGTRLHMTLGTRLHMTTYEPGDEATYKNCSAQRAYLK